MENRYLFEINGHCLILQQLDGAIWLREGHSGRLGNLADLKAQGADTLVFRTKSRETALDIDAMLSLGVEDTLFALTHSGADARLTVGGVEHNELL